MIRLHLRGGAKPEPSDRTRQRCCPACMAIREKMIIATSIRREGLLVVASPAQGVMPTVTTTLSEGEQLAVNVTVSNVSTSYSPNNPYCYANCKISMGPST